MNNFNSNDINVYPLSTTRHSDVRTGAQDTFLSEFAITNLIKFITDRESYVVGKEDGKLWFVVKGYMFRLNTSVKPVLPLYVTLKKKPNNTSTLFPEILSDDPTGSTFLGLEYDNKSGDLQLYDKNGEIPESSKIKFEIKKSTDFFSGYNIIVDGDYVKTTPTDSN